jgi:hypothetical protein
MKKIIKTKKGFQSAVQLIAIVAFILIFVAVIGWGNLNAIESQFDIIDGFECGVDKLGAGAYITDCQRTCESTDGWDVHLPKGEESYKAGCPEDYYCCKKVNPDFES